MPRQSDPITQFILPYHPQYGLHDTTRVEVLRLIVDWRVTPKQAAEMYNLHVSTIYKWLRDAEQSTQSTQSTQEKGL